MKPKTEHGNSTAIVRQEYLAAASYYWFKAVGNDEQLVSSLNRIQAQRLALELGAYVPTPEEVRAYAIERFPAHKIHSIEGEKN